jgi:WD40 repeat protein
MGTCSTKDQKRSHERLNEFDQKYFARWDARNFAGRRNRWKKNNGIHGTLSERFDDDVLKDMPTLLPAQPWTLSSSEGEPSPSSEDTVDAPPWTLAKTGTTPTSFYSGMLDLSPSTSPSGARQSEITTEDGQSSDWQMSSHGHALQLRLAKHRFLQIAVTKKSSAVHPTGNALSPLTMDSTSKVTPTSQYSELTDQTVLKSGWTDPLILTSESELVDGRTMPYSDEPIVDFDEMQSIVWKEIPQDHKVTALTMSSAANTSPSFCTDRLMLAMGDETGNIVVSTIVDEVASSHTLSADPAGQDSQLDLFPIQPLKFCIAERVRSLDFAKERYLAAGGDSCSVWILEIIFDGTNQRLLKDLVAIHKVQRIDRVYAVRFSPDHRYLAIGGFDGKTALIPMEEIWKEETIERKTDDRSDDDSLMADSMIEILEKSIVELDKSGLTYCLDWSPAGDYLAVAGSNKSCAIYETKSFDLVHETASRSTAIQALQWNQNGTFLAVGGREVAIIEGQAPFKVHCVINHTPTDSTMNEFRYRINSLCWSPSGSYLAIGGADGICSVVETNGYTLVHEIHRTQSITALAWGQQCNVNGDVRRYLALSDEDFNVALVKAGAEVRTYEATDDHSSVASSSHFSSSSEWVLREDTFRDLEDVAPYNLPSALKPHGNNVTAVAFSKKSGKSKTSSYLAFACDDCSLTIMTTRDWKVVFVSTF